jgi:hypothetical protein
MTWLLESPWPVITLGVVLQIALAIVLVRTSRASVLLAMALVLVLCAGLVLLERVVVTKREAVEDALDGAAAALEANDPAGVLQAFAPDSPRRGEVERVLGRFNIRDAHVGGDLEVVTNELTIPPSATAYFTGRVEASDGRGEVPYEHLIQKFKVTLHREGDRWLIFDYAMADPQGGSWSRRTGR